MESGGGTILPAAGVTATSVAQHMKQADNQQTIVIHSPVSAYDIKSDHALMHFTTCVHSHRWSAATGSRPESHEKNSGSVNKDTLPTLRPRQYFLPACRNRSGPAVAPRDAALWLGTSPGQFGAFMATRFRQARVLCPPDSVGGKVPRQQFISPTAALGWWSTLRFWIGRRRQRRKLDDLTELNNYLLRDIGVSHDEALHEVARLFRR
jgi:uncharacterized protein YjiS (DUF1127 family)